MKKNAVPMMYWIWVMIMVLIAIIIWSLLHFAYYVSPYEIVERKTREYMGASDNMPKCGIIFLAKNPVDFPMWVKYHRDLGIQHFFVRMEDSDGWEDYLKHQNDITYELEKSGTNNYNTLQERQGEFVSKMIPVAREKGIEWVFHIDTDELLEGDLGVLSTVEEDIKWVKIENAEAVFDGTEKTCFDAKRFLKCKQGAACRSYVNGKAAARTVEGVSPNGPHDFIYRGNEGDKNMEIPFDTLHVLHFESCSFGAWAEKYKNLSSQTTDNKIPFPYYTESIEASKKAYELYQKNVMPDIGTFQPTEIYEKR